MRVLGSGLFTLLLTAAAGSAAGGPAVARRDPAIVGGQWTWVSGSDRVAELSFPGVYGTKGVAASENLPGEREFSVSWTDASGNLMLFGG